MSEVKENTQVVKEKSSQKFDNEFEGVYALYKTNNLNFSGVTSYAKTHTVLIPSQNSRGLGLLTGLESREEEEYFENKLGLQKGMLKPTSDIWEKELSVSIIGDTLHLDPKNTMDYLRIKWLKKSKIVAQGKDGIPKNPKAPYVLESKAEEFKNANKKFKSKRKAYQLFGKMSSREIIDFLSSKGKMVENNSVDAIETMAQEELERDPLGFIETVNDPLYKYKVLVNKGVLHGVIRKKGSNYMYDGEVLGSGLQRTVEYLSDPKNQNVLSAISSVIEDKIQKKLEA